MAEIDQGKLESLFFQARELESEKRVDFLSEACGYDEKLREAVAAMLAADMADESLLDRPCDVAETAESPAAQFEGSTIGRYKLLQKLGEGGFGAVFMAEQLEPVTRKVALKIIKPGMDSKAVIARFEVERQALAMMDHPNIAKVLDGGETPEQRPYFVMELVRGVSITDYCDKRRLTANDRLRLFVDVCNAVQHAHQKGIIHRDLKPNNVMITLHDGKPVVKVIDFGVARAVHQKLTDKTLFTRYGQMIGTPQYMSPEQAEMSGLDVDTRSDIYSLGVLLYELLTGSPPLTRDAFQEAGLAEIKRLICELEFAKPSTRLSTTAEQELSDVADHRGVSPEVLRKQCQGDLDWVVMKTLEKERDRRYSTASDLAADIYRYLTDQAVEARPPSLGYRLQKYVRRNRVMVGTAAFVALVLIAATTVSSSLAVWAVGEKRTSDDRLSQVRFERDQKEAARAEQERLRTIATRQANTLEQRLYEGNLSRAYHAFNDSNLPAATEHVLKCPERIRGWEWRRLESKLRAVQYGEVPGCERTLFSHDGSRFTTVGGEGFENKICTWDTKTLECLQKLPVGDDQLQMNAMHPDGDIVAVSAEGQLTVLDLRSGEELWAEDAAHRQRIDGLSFSPDGKHLASVSWDGYLKVWDATSGKLIRQRGGLGSLRDVKFCPTGRRLATAGYEGDAAVRIWTTDTLEIERTFDHFGSGVVTLAFNPEGTRLACGGIGGLASIQDIETGEIELLLSRHDNDVEAISFSHDGNQLACGIAGVVKIWDAQSGELVREVMNDHARVYWLAYSPNDEMLTTFGTRFDKPMSTLVHDLSGVEGPDWVHSSTDDWIWAHPSYSPDGSELAVAGIEPHIIILDAKSGAITDYLVGHTAGIQALSWGRKCMKIYSLDINGNVRAWNRATKSIEWAVAIDGELGAFQRRDSDLEFTSDGRLLVTQEDRGVVVLDPKDGQELARLRGSSGSVHRVASSPDGKLIATANTDKDNTLVLWNAETYQQLKVLRGHTSDLRQIAFSPDSKLVASTSHDKTTRLWDCNTGEQLRCFTGHSYGSWSCVFSLNGKRLFSCDGNGLLLGWDVDNGNEVFRYSSIRCPFIDISPDGKTIACSGLGIHFVGTELPAKQLANQRQTYRQARHVIAQVERQSPMTSDQLHLVDGVEPLTEDVRKAAREMIKIRGDNPHVMIVRSWELLNQRSEDHYASALGYAQKAWEIVPDCAEYAVATGWLQLRLGRTDQAISTFEKALKLDSVVLVDENWNTVDLRCPVYAGLAIANHRLGNDKSHDQLSKSREFLPVASNTTSRFQFRHLVNEAEEFLKNKVAID